MTGSVSSRSSMTCTPRFWMTWVPVGLHPPTLTSCVVRMHYDHVGWNTRLEDGRWIPTFPNATYLIDSTEYAEIRQLQIAGDWHGEHLSDSVDPIVTAGLHRFIDAAGYRVCEEIQLVPTPGHTSGHCS